MKEFVYFISRSTFLQDVAFGTKTVKLHSGESIPIPALVRTMHDDQDCASLSAGMQK